MARYQEDAQSNTKDNRASPLHTIVSPKRLFASLQHLLALHGCLLIEITLAHTILLVLVSSPHPASQESAGRNFTKTLLAIGVTYVTLIGKESRMARPPNPSIRA